MATISVVVPVFNRALIVGRAVESVLAQALPDGDMLETIVVDDGSSDDIAAVLRNYGDSVRHIRHDRNQGAATARNTGVAAASGEYIAFLDSDDLWLPRKLAVQIEAMRTRGWVASCTAYYLANSSGLAIKSPRYETGTIGSDELIWGCFVSPGSTLICERGVFEQVGSLDSSLERLEDWDWLLRYAQSYPLGFCSEPLARIEPSTGGDAAKVIRALGVMEIKHLSRLSGVQRRYFTAALCTERAAAYYRQGSIARFAISALRAIWQSPFRNDALRAVVHNRLGRV